MNRPFIILVLMSFFCLSSCIVTGPQYTRVEKVLKLSVGMSSAEVENTLGIHPYDLCRLDSLGNKTVIYKYRVTDRRTVPFFLKDTNGFKVRGKFVDLYATYNVKDTLIALHAQPSQSKLTEKKLNINTLLTFLTVTAPAVLIFFGIKSSM